MKTDTDSFDYCIDFWEDALDDDLDEIARELEVPQHVRAFDDLA